MCRQKLHRLLEKDFVLSLKEQDVLRKDQGLFSTHFPLNFLADLMNKLSPERKLTRLPFTFHKHRELAVHKGFHVKAIHSPLKSSFHPKSR